MNMNIPPEVQQNSTKSNSPFLLSFLVSLISVDFHLYDQMIIQWPILLEYKKVKWERTFFKSIKINESVILLKLDTDPF